jgi:HlyD family secretion protein
MLSAEKIETWQRFAALAALAALGACGEKSIAPYQGYAEGEYVRVAAPFAGNLQQLQVKRGSEVKAGDPLFTLEQENEAAARREAEERLRNAEAQLEDLKKGKRPPEVDTVKAQLEQARASLRLSEASLRRQLQLLASNFVSKAAVDDARANYERDKAHVAELEAQVVTVRLAARQDQIRAAEHNVTAEREALAQADWRLAQKSVRAPVAGLVNDTNYVLGEWVPAGSPVVSMLPPQNIKVRFFVPESVLGAIRSGQQVDISCDGCGAPIAAHITFISPLAEFTPPVIYSRESRAKLVFLIEARSTPEDAVKLHPGQPVEVRLKP